MGRRIQRTSSQSLKDIILGPTKGKYYYPTEVCDEVYPGIVLGDASTALSTCLLKELGVTHVLNAAHGKNDKYNYGYVNTSHSNYKQAGIKFMGVPAMDCPSYYLRSHFQDGADFIDKALRSGGKVLCHCIAGISRSATLVTAYLMLKKGLGVEEAIATIRKRRSIIPNEGFLSQLCDFELELRRSGKLTIIPKRNPSAQKASSEDSSSNQDNQPMASQATESCSSNMDADTSNKVEKRETKDGQETYKRSPCRKPTQDNLNSPHLLSSSDLIPDPRLRTSLYVRPSPTYYYAERPYTKPYYEPYNCAKYNIYEEYPSLIPDFMTYPRPDCYISLPMRIANDRFGLYY